jgi:hypothetical protein
MAAEGERSKVRLDAFTSKVVPDPKNPGEALLVTGFLGASPEPEHTRIYWDASLSTSVDVNASDIIHIEPLPKEQSPLGGSFIWLKRAAQVFFGRSGGQSMQGKFFEGPLMAAYGGQFGGAGGAGAAGMGAGINITYSFQVICHPTIVCTLPVYCNPSPYHPCLSAYCTRYIECSALCPPQTFAGCWLTPNCPVASPGCPPVGPDTPVQGQGAAAAGAAPMQFGMMQFGIPSLICSYGPGCWFSWGACPTFFGCGPFHTPNCPRVEAAYPGPAIRWTGWACGSGYLCPGPHSIGSCGHPCTQ